MISSDSCSFTADLRFAEQATQGEADGVAGGARLGSRLGRILTRASINLGSPWEVVEAVAIVSWCSAVVGYCHNDK